MIDRTTPETDDIARGNHVVPTEWAQQLERERDEARKEAHRFRSLHYSHLGINASASWFPWEEKSGHE
jgi:hypothetical protein